jgi:hypothetical protein
LDTQKRGKKGGEKGKRKKGGGEGVVKNQRVKQREISLSLSQPSFLSSFLCFLLEVVVVFVNGGAFRQRRCVNAFAPAASVAAQRASERRENGGGELLLG